MCTYYAHMSVLWVYSAYCCVYVLCECICVRPVQMCYLCTCMLCVCRSDVAYSMLCGCVCIGMNTSLQRLF